MSDEKYSQMPAADPLTGTELTCVAQGGTSKRTTPTAYVTLASGVIVPIAAADATAKASAALAAANVFTNSKFPVSNANLDDMAEAAIKGRAVGAGVGDPQDLTAAQVKTILGLFTDTLAGLTPLSGGGTANFLRADGAWAAPAAGGSPQYANIYDTVGQALVDGIASQILFGAAVVDVGDWWDISIPGSVIVPVGVTVVRLSARLQVIELVLGSAGIESVELLVNLNGSLIVTDYVNYPADQVFSEILSLTALIPVVAGDVFTVEARATYSGGGSPPDISVNLGSTPDTNGFTIEKVA